MPPNTANWCIASSNTAHTTSLSTGDRATGSLATPGKRGEDCTLVDIAGHNHSYEATPTNGTVDIRTCTDVANTEMLSMSCTCMSLCRCLNAPSRKCGSVAIPSAAGTYGLRATKLPVTLVLSPVQRMTWESEIHGVTTLSLILESSLAWTKPTSRRLAFQ